jgi:DNA mismatch endonuclease (patch repair protein)
MIHPRWAACPPQPETWKPPAGRSVAEARAEQDTAAGGRAMRTISLPDGARTVASIELKQVGGRRIYAYLRYTRARRTVSVYVGEAAGTSRVERLRVGWTAAQAKGLLSPE